MSGPYYTINEVKLGDVKTIVEGGTIAEAICVGFGREGAIFITQIDGGTEPEEIEIYQPRRDHIFDDTLEGRTAAVALWRGEK